MKTLALSLCLLLVPCWSLPSNAAEVPLKTVTLDAFMQGMVMGGISVPVVVPSAYEPAVLPKANVGYSYWMKPEDVAASNATGDLPGHNGYMYGKLSPNVGYDAQRDLFIGLEEPASIEKAKRQMADLVIERYRSGPYAIVLMSFATPDRKTVVYSMYVATNISTNVVYIALRPPGNSAEAGEKIWHELKGKLEKVSK